MRRKTIISFCVIVDEKRNRLDKFLAHELVNISRNKIQSLIEAGHVCVDDKIEKNPNYYLKRGERIDLDYEKLPKNSVPLANSDVNFSILYEDEDIIVINKPAGVVVHPGAGNYDHTLVNGLVYRYNLSSGSDESRLGIVHRIDKNTSGVLVVAKNDHAHALLAEQFQIHSIKRKYICFCFGVPRMKVGTIETMILRDPNNRLKMSVSKEKGKFAVTNYKILKSFFSFASKIECELHTGRTHQIRVHMSHIGNSLIGDSTYKKKNYPLPKEIAKYINEFPRQALHAYLLEFVHPRSKEIMHFEIGLPEDLKELEEKMSQVTLNNS